VEALQRTQDFTKGNERTLQRISAAYESNARAQGVIARMRERQPFTSYRSMLRWLVSLTSPPMV
jgi:hypothetical protein